MRRAVIVALALLPLAACQKSAQSTAKPAAAGQPPVAQASAPVAPPARKPGLWRQTVTTAGVTQTMKLCLDAAQAQATQFTGPQGASACAAAEVSAVAGGWKFQSVCDEGQGGKVTTTGTATGDFASNYTVEAQSVTTGSAMPQANGAHSMSLQAVWEGPCPAGMKPGDMQLPNGMTLNMAALQAQAGANR